MDLAWITFMHTNVPVETVGEAAGRAPQDLDGKWIYFEVKRLILN
jgi:hypothetical protein